MKKRSLVATLCRDDNCAMTSRGNLFNGTVKFHSLKLFDFWKKCEACLTASYTIACKRVTEGVPQHPKIKQKVQAAPLRASNVCDEGNFSFPEECALAPSLTERCRLRLLNKKEVDWNFRVPGPFAYFSVMKSM